MSDQWYYIAGEDQNGPVSEIELKQQLTAINLDAQRVLVWRDGMADWLDPRTVPGLLGAAPAAAAPAPVAAAPMAAATPAVANADPYQAPASALQEQPSAPLEGGNYPLDIGACINTGWKMTLSQFGKLILFGLSYMGIVFVFMIPLGILEGVMGVQQDGSEPTGSQVAVTAFCEIVQNVVSLFFGIGAAMFGLGMVKQANPGIGLLFSGGRHFFPVLGASILFGLIVVIGVICLIVPGIWLALRLGQFQLAIVDRNLGPIEGLKASWEMTRGNALMLFVFGLAIFGICLLGLLALGIGLLWAYPTAFIAGSAAYLNMSRGVDSLPRLP